MSSGIIASVVAPHTPRIGIESSAPDFARGLIGGLRDLGEALSARKPDLIVLFSSHWVSTFNWYVTAQATHEGVCVADEAPDLIPGIPYRYPGHPGFAASLAEALRSGGIPCGLNESGHFRWDYGSLVPLQYLFPLGDLPVVLLPSVVCSDTGEARQVGQQVDAVARAAGQRVVFIASCALSHQVIRGPELWPSEAHQAMDHRLMDLVSESRAEEVIAYLPEFCQGAVAEMGGRPLSGHQGTLEAMLARGADLKGAVFGPYTQSSGSGNACLAFFDEKS